MDETSCVSVRLFLSPKLLVIFCVYSYLDIYLGSDYHVFGAEKKTLRFEHVFGIMKVLEVGNMERTMGKGRDMEGTKQ